MPSVQELLAILETQKSPLQSFLEGFAGSYSDAQKRRLDDEKKILEIQQMRENQARQAQMDKEIRRQIEDNTQAGLRSTGAAPAVLPAQKLSLEISQDETGRYSRKLKTVDTAPEKYSFEKYLDKDGKTRIGRANKSTGEIEQRPTDPEAPSAPTSFILGGSQDGKPVMINPKTLEAKTVNLPGDAPLMSTTQTEGQANAKLYAKRMEDAHKQIDAISQKVDLSSASSGLQGVRMTPNFMKSEDIQSYDQSKRNFLNAVLRRESGAVISPSEMAEGNKQYFTVFGDKPEVIAQKKLNREAAIQGLRNAAGEAPKATGGGKTQKIGRFTVEVHD